MSDETLGFAEQMPEYLCHKRVRALKIKNIVKKPVFLGIDQVGSNYDLVFEDTGFANFVVTEQFMRRSHCKAGGYLVRYEDGYVSYSPPKAFEDGYTRVGNVAKPLTIEEFKCIGNQAMRGYPDTNYNPNETREK